MSQLLLPTPVTSTPKHSPQLNQPPTQVSTPQTTASASEKEIGGKFCTFRQFNNW